MRFAFGLAIGFWIASSAIADPATPAVKLPAPLAGRVDFAQDVWPILKERCIQCHNATKRKGGFSMANAFAVNTSKRAIAFFGTALELSKYEYEILRRFIERRGHVFSRDQLMTMVWEQPETSLDRTIDAHIKNIRAKLRAIRPDLDPIVTHRAAAIHCGTTYEAWRRSVHCLRFDPRFVFFISAGTDRNPPSRRLPRERRRTFGGYGEHPCGICRSGHRSGGISAPTNFIECLKTRAAARLRPRFMQMRKDSVDLSVYITDAKGIVLFDSDNRETIGQDFSLWRDVKLTLEGEYGARIRRDPNDPDAPAALFVAAPVRVAGKIAGVLTVIKPTTNIAAFVGAARPRMFRISAVSLAAAIILGLLMTMWVNQQVVRLTSYANNVRQGRRVPFPKLARTELKTMGIAFEKMREALDGRAYVEQYVEALTHEIKSPISAIRGAAEIIEDPSISTEQRARFLSNIQSETRRIQELVDRMLKLTELEARTRPGFARPGRSLEGGAPDHRCRRAGVVEETTAR